MSRASAMACVLSAAAALAFTTLAPAHTSSGQIKTPLPSSVSTASPGPGQPVGITFCSRGVRDLVNPGMCIPASTVPTNGALLPLGDKFFVTEMGQVGLGTQEPLAQLSVRGGLSHQVAGTVQVLAGTTRVVGAGTSFLAELQPGSSVGVESELFTVTSITNDLELFVSPPALGTHDGAILWTGGPLLSVEAPNGAEAVHVDHLGNVGLGTSPSGDRLSVGGAIRSEAVGFVFPDGSIQDTASRPSVGSQVVASSHRSTSSTNWSDTGMEVTLETGGGPVLLLFSGMARGGPGPVTVAFVFEVDGQLVTNATFGNQSFNDEFGYKEPVSFQWLTPLAAGTHTFKVKWRVSSGTGILSANSNNARQFQVIELN